MIKKQFFLTVILLLTGYSLFAQSKQEQQVTAAVEQLRNAMIDGDSAMLFKLTASNLNYVHSGGHVDNKAEFVKKLNGGGSDFVTIELKDQAIIMLDKKTAVVRHTLNATTNDNNKPAEVHLFVMLVWQKQHGIWKLVARQAAKKL